MLLSKKLPFTFIAFYLGFLTMAFAQSATEPNTSPPIRTCQTKEIHQEKMDNDPVYKKQFLEKQERAKRMQLLSAGQERELCGNPVLLPMAIHFQGISSPDETCLRDLAAIQVQILNDDYQGSNADIVNWTNDASSYFPGVSNGETCIEFCIATLNHPSGYGLVNGDPAVTINQFTGDFNSDWSGYINVFVRNIGPLGYSPLGGNGNGDGVTIDVSAFGSGPGCAGVVPGSPYHLGRTLTHELGHYMNLDHIWGGGCGNDDGVGDTPDSEGPWYGCPALGSQTCSTNDMHMNYMDYTNDACMYMFSAGQSTVMEDYTASDLGGVSGNSGVCMPPVPTVSFTSATTNSTEGSSSCFTAGAHDITITLSIGVPASADTDVTFVTAGTATDGIDYVFFPPSVTFPAGSSDDQIVTITIYEDAEIESDEDIQMSYTIDANGGDAIAGSSNQTHTVNIINDDNPPSTNALVTVISQDFNGGLGAWTVTSDGSAANTWELSSANGGLDGSQYILVDSDAGGSGTTMDEKLFSPVFDGSTVTGLNLEFDQYINIYAGGGDFNETFDVDIWDGSSWQNVFTWGEADGDIGDWNAPDHQNIDISAHADANNQLRFTYIAEWDWWWALDNITVTGIGSTDIQLSNNVTSGSVDYEFGPMSTIHFYDEDTGNIMMTLVNNSSHDYGCTHVEVDRGAGSPPGATESSAPESQFVTDKTFRVVPEINNPSGNYTISLYYTDAEITGWVAETGNPASDLSMVKAANAVDGAVFLEVAPTTVTPFGTDHIYTADYSSGFSGFALGGPPDPLPVELVDIKAIPHEQSILVKWTTASETNNKGFELWRSTSPQNGFERIAWIDGAGTTSAINDYRQEDPDVTPGVLYYYQLKQIDFDGNNSLSKIVSATLDAKSIYVALFPNPVKEVLQLTIDSPLSGTYTIVHANGQLVDEQTFQAGAQLLAIDMKAYARGVYWMLIQTEQERIVKKVVLGKL